MTTLAAALLADLEPPDLDRLAELLAPRILARAAPHPPDDGWLNSKQAADYLGLSVTSLHKLTAARAIPFEQDAPGAKCWFKRSDMDAWRRGQVTS